ncbi:nuclear receptor corepressor [Striga asiatica]|uniref:Nuclear receptor corepressor n=1 Tax=Striga asiatica TaxID=4170 RepID=A0A5A7QUD1_STRAF|nr:nuclear receptor corepressor [Striga asiatica]
MPPEQLPWDRRDFRKHDRSGSDRRFTGGGGGRGGFGGGDHRWREQHHNPHAPPHPPPYHHHRNHPQQQRWYSDFRSSRPIPPGHGKQGGWGMYPDEAGHGFSPFGSRYGDRNIEDDNFRPFGSRSEGRYFRSSRENRGSFSQKDWKSPSCEPPLSSSGGYGRPNGEVTNQKSVENTQTCHTNCSKGNNSENGETCHNNCSKGNNSENIHNNSSKGNNSPHPPTDSLSCQPQAALKEKYEKDGGTVDEPASSVQKSDKRNAVVSLDWKLKWDRSGSLSSRGSGLSRSSSSKSTAVDSVEGTAEAQPKNMVPIDSPAAVSLEPTARVPSDDTGSRKKPRLGWGEGLAKYEKKKVEGPEDGVAKDVLANSVSSAETTQLPSANVLEKSPKPADGLDCASPATPSSVACSSSPGTEEKQSIKAVIIDHDPANLSFSPINMAQSCCEEPTFNLENLDLASIANLSSLINGILQPDDPSSAETSYARANSMNKLLVWKVNVLKALEVTESEIDLLEKELKSLVTEPRSCCPYPAASILLPGECHSNSFEQATVSSAVRAAPLQVVASGDMIVESPSADDEDSGSDEDEDDTDSQDLSSVGSMDFDFEHIYEAILASNKDYACTAMEELNKLLPVQQCPFNVLAAAEISSPQRDSSFIKERFLMRKRSLLFKEKVLTLKFKVFQHFWREGRVVSVSKLRGKSHKKLDLCRPGYKKNRSSSRSRISHSVIILVMLMVYYLLLVLILTLKSPEFYVFLVQYLDDLAVFFPIWLPVPPRFYSKKHIIPFGLIARLPEEPPDAIISFSLSLECQTNIFVHQLHIGNLLVYITSKGFIGSSLQSTTDRTGSSRKVPAEEVVEFINELLRESQIKPCRSTLKMPAMILDQRIKMSRFISNNALVEDPCATEKERSMINPWTPEEMELFIDKLSEFGKDFSKISSFLERKTVADCIEFYYKNHKSESFQRAKPGVTKQSKSQPTTYLVANGKRWNREANAASLDVLGEASMIAANAIEAQQKPKKAPPRNFHGPLERLNSLDNNEAAAADVLAGICGSLSSGEAMSSCITSSVDPVDGYTQRVTSCVKLSLTPDVTQSVNDEGSDESCAEMVDPTDWTDEEKSFFVQAVSSYGKDFEMISQCLRTRSVEQCKIFFSKARKCLGLDHVTPGPVNAAACGGDADGGGGSSDTEDAACVIANDDSECKMEVDPPESCSHEPDIARTSEESKHFDSVITEPVLKDSSTADNTLVDYKQAVDFNVDNIELCCSDGAFTPELEVKTSVASTNINESVQAEESNDHGQPTNGGPNDTDKKGLAEVSNGHHMEDNEGQGLILSDDNLENKKVEDGGANSTEVNVVSSTPVEVEAENISHPSVASSLSSIEKDSESQSNPPLEQNGHCAAPMESSTLFPVPIKYQKPLNGTSQNDPQKVALAGDSHQHVLGYSLSDSVKRSHILTGYPVSVQTLKEINGDVVKHIAVQNVPKSDSGKLNLELHTDFSLQKCSTGFRNQIDNVSFLPQSGCSPVADKPPQPSRNGDVKLFGKILISSQEKTSSCDRDVVSSNNNNNGHHHQSLTLKFSGDDKAVNLDSFQSKVDCHSYLASSENSNIPFKSFGCWDENRTKQPTIFQPLPDSTLLLAKYPAAFSTHSTPTLKFDQPPLFATRDMNNCTSDYQLLRNRELQPFTVDSMKQQQEVLFAEMQRRNGFSVVQGMQQQAARSMVGLDVGRGVLQCTGVSDPVTAIKLHYAKAQSISVQAGNVIREDDTWRSNGDVGR